MKEFPAKADLSASRIHAIPYLPSLIRSPMSGREKEIMTHLVEGGSDETVAGKVGCRSRAVKHFRERLEIPDLRQRSLCRQMPFTILQSFGVWGESAFMTILMRRLPGMQLQEMSGDFWKRQSFSPASETTLTLADLEELLREAAQGSQPDSESRQRELQRSIAVHAEAKKYLPTDGNRDRPISVMLLAGKNARKWEAEFKKTSASSEWTILQMATLREMISFLDCSVFSLYSARAWLGLGAMVKAAQLKPAEGSSGLSCCLDTRGVLRLIDEKLPSGKNVPAAGTALQPPNLHLRQLGRSDQFLFEGRQDRLPVYYTAKPWDASGKLSSVAFMLPYDLPESMELYAAPAWLGAMRPGVWIEEQEGERYLGAIATELLGAVARAVRSLSFKKAVRAGLEGQLGLRGSPYSSWCQHVWKTTAKRRGLAKEEMELTAVGALLSFEIDFLMRHFDRAGQELVTQIESQWQSRLTGMLNDFAKRVQGDQRVVSQLAVGDFVKVHRRPVRFMLVNARRMAEQICKDQVRLSAGNLPQRLDLLLSSPSVYAKKERDLITQTLRQVGLFAGIAVSENQLRSHFMNYAYRVGCGDYRKSRPWVIEVEERVTRHSLAEAEDERGKRLAERRMYYPEFKFDDDKDELGGGGFSGGGWSVLTTD